MDQSAFKEMWERMQDDGYFKHHPHYQDFFGLELTDADRALDEAVLALNFDSEDIEMPAPYSEALERSVKRTEENWLPRMFQLPERGTALDIGCGFGRSVIWLRDKYEKVHATDISSSVVELAEKLCAAENVSFHVNDADSLPAGIPAGSVDVAYIFTVFQHIPREFAGNLLKQASDLLAPGGVAVFNLISEVNESLNDGVVDTEWAIGYTRDQARELVEDAGLEVERIVRWYRPENEVSWLWVAGRKV